MRLFTRTITIAKPRDAVFDFFVDFSQSSRWRQYVTTMEPVTPGPLRPGTMIRTHFDIAGKITTLDLEVDVCDRPSRWRHTVDEVDLRTSVEYGFEWDPAGTRVTMRMDIAPVTPYGWLSMPLMLLHRGNMYRDQLPQLKRALESS
jgi:hypothetical protein